MLHKSFKPAKCKTALNLAKSRIKLLKNKKEVQVKQLKRELAGLLNSGQDQTARIRVEHVVREEKAMAAFELIEIYCELIVARLPIIESQKNCPLDLKEAITSLIFAAPRCGDIPELQDVRKLFTAKYGKEFVAAAVELRPACGVSRIMVEKLSVKAPDGPTKVKILTAIAEEYNIKWEPKWFKDEPEMPSTDLPQVQLTERVNTIQMQPLNFEISDDPPERLAREEAREARSATSSQSHVHADANSSAVPHSASSHADTRFGSSSERATSSRPYGAAENVLPTSRHNWNMEFKDATSAAQAAAESAERASMAARAAAELATYGKIINDSSSGPVASSIHASREGSGVYPGIILQEENVEKNHTNSFKHMSSRMSGVQHDEIEQGNMKEGDEAPTFKEEYMQYGIKGEFGEVKTNSNPVQDMRKSIDSLTSPSTSRAESNVFQSPNQEYRNEPAENTFQGNSVQKEKQPSSFQPQYSAFDDEYSIFSRQDSTNDQDDGSFGSFHQGTATYDDWHVEDDPGSYGVTDNIIFREERKRDPFPGSDEQKNVFHSREDVFVSTDHRLNEIDIEEMGTHADTGVVFDESGSDDDAYNANHVQESYDLPSPGKSVPKNFLSHEENPPENLRNQSSFSRHPPYGLEVSESFRESPIYAKLSEPVPIAFDSDEASSEGEKELRNERIESQESSKSLRFPLQAPVPISRAEVGMELNFGQLPGGRRNRPLQNPPYTRTSGDDVFYANQQTKASFNEIGYPQSPKETSTSNTQFASTSDDPDVATVPKVSNITTRPYGSKIGENMHRTSPKSSAWYFDSDDSESEDAAKQSSSSKTLLGAGVSRRTKAPSKRSVASDNISEDSPSSPVETTQFRSKNTGSLKRNDEASSMPRPQTRDTRSKAEGSVFSSVSPPKEAEIPRASSSYEKAPSRENSGKNLSHVHPKLPDFESFTAHLQSLRTNRR